MGQKNERERNENEEEDEMIYKWNIDETEKMKWKIPNSHLPFLGHF